ncbi:hypothetical protein PH210_19470 [Paenibacillus sp. BSR1-1]|uniref:sensor histidine kinase n=1 Tax=Paenibacillus sp. BSR1-1 TaxID=3020845 RepID=UPI0025B0E03D|nr:ATP-binding protein [Paenibacillus sp. BSR1-1]MDN3018363.1 hypothetical protein [Paenibacillus sp. BSR1-1]
MQRLASLPKVFDNGSGMDEQTLSTLQRRLLEDEHTLGGKNIGIKNVHDRIRLHFGAEYGLQIESKPGEGTAVTICLPIVQFTEEVVMN